MHRPLRRCEAQLCVYEAMKLCAPYAAKTAIKDALKIVDVRILYASSSGITRIAEGSCATA
jgi:hypothetical protein